MSADAAQTKPAGAMSAEELEDFTAKLVAALKTVHDPEIPVDIYELGLIYKVDVNDENKDVTVDMTLTAPACPVAGEMPGMVKAALETVDGIGAVTVRPSGVSQRSRRRRTTCGRSTRSWTRKSS